MRLRSLASVVALGFVFGCSTDSTPTKSGDAASTQGGTGGNTGSPDGNSSTGGASAANCPVDAGTDTCRLCLATNCCTAYTSCVGDSTCSHALDEYRHCVDTATNSSDQGACIGGFSRTMKDAGTSAPLGNAIGGCVYAHCTLCGASAI